MSRPLVLIAGAVAVQVLALGGVFLAGYLAAAGARWSLPVMAGTAIAVAGVAAAWFLCHAYFRARATQLAQISREAAFSLVTENVPGKFYRRIQRPDGRVEFPYFFGSARRALAVGRPNAVMEGAEEEAIIHPADREARRLALEASAQDMTPYEVEFRICHPTGEVDWVWSKGLPSRLPDGSIAWDCLSLDITDRKRAERQLHDSEAMIRSVTENVPGYIYRRVRRADGTFELPYMSADPLGLLGYPLAEIEADPARANANIHPDDRERRAAAIEQSARDLTPHNLEFRRILADGTVRWVRSVASPRHGENGETIWDGIALDVTDLKTAEAALREREELIRGITARIPGYIYRRLRRTDGTQEVLFISESPHGLIGADLREIEADPDRAAASVHPEDRAARLAAFEESARTLAPVNTEFRRILGDGSIRWVRSLAAARRMDNGDVVWDGIAIDITDLKEAEQALRQSEEKFRVVADALPAGIGIARLSDEKGLYVNEAMRRQFSLPADMSVGVLAKELYVDEAERQAFLAQLHEAGQVNGCEVRMRSLGGREFWCALYARRVVLDGVPCLVGGFVDMTERRQAELALAESEAQLRAILENAPIIISLKDLQGRYIIMNGYHSHYFAVTDEEARGRTVLEVFGPRVADLIETVDRQVLAERRPLTFEIEVPGDNGDRVLLETKFPVSRPDGTLIGLCTVGLDITDRKRTDRALGESEARFRALVENVPAMVTLKDSRFRYLFVNPRFLEWQGIDDSDAIGRTRDELPVSYDRSRVSRIEREVMESGEPQSFEADLQHADGTMMSTFQTKFPIPGPDGRPMALGTFCYDITDRKRAEAALRAAEERFRQFAESASDWMWETDAQYRFTYVSERRQAVLGLPAESILGRTRQDVADVPTDSPAWRRHLADVEARRPFRDFETATLDTKGRLHIIRVNGNPVFARDGTFQGYRGTARDVTEERDREAQLVQAQKMQAIGELTGGIAHDFNNLLGVVLTNLDLLAESLEGDAEAVRIVDRAVRATLRGADLTRGLVAFARKQSLHPVETDLNQLVVGLVEMLGRTLGETIEVRSHLAGDLWPTLVDRGQMESTLVNLAVNARDAMPSGGRLDIETANVTLGERVEGQRFHTKPGDYVCISVSDTGTGIDPQHVNRVFEPFFTTKEVGKGSGLGLSMVFGFVKQSEGYVAVDSTPGRGTTIAIYLPRLAVTELAGESSDAADAASLDQHGHGRKILVVEDEDSVRQAVVSILQGLDYRVTEARTGPEAVAILEDGDRPDLLLTDVVLPGGLGGRDIANAARKRWPDLPILFTTGYTRDADELVDDPGTGFLRKPFRRADLAAAIRRLMDYVASP